MHRSMIPLSLPSSPQVTSHQLPVPINSQQSPVTDNMCVSFFSLYVCKLTPISILIPFPNSYNKHLLPSFFVISRKKNFGKLLSKHSQRYRVYKGKPKAEFTEWSCFVGCLRNCLKQLLRN